MTNTYRRIRQQRIDDGVDVGFTLIELLIVIVVLGILAAVVVFALGSVTSQSAVSACSADGASIQVAMAAYNAQNGTDPTAISDMVGKGLATDNSTSNLPHYAYKIAAVSGVETLEVAIAPAGAVVAATSAYASYLGPKSCIGVQ